MITRRELLAAIPAATVTIVAVAESTAAADGEGAALPCVGGDPLGAETTNDSEIFNLP